MKKYNFAILLFFPFFLFSQTNLPPTLFNHFYTEDTIHINIETDLKALVRKKDSDNYQSAKLSFVNREGMAENWNIRVRARGNLRKAVCYLPPLKIKFSEEDLEQKSLSGSRKIKLVTQCKSAKSAEQYVLQEHLVYKLYNLITEESFRVQLVYFTIQDSNGKMKDIESFGFFIEDADDMADRLAARIIKPKFISPRGLEAAPMDRMCIFQYMIGNTDWHIYNSHNLKIVSAPDYRLALVVPYDFDFSGLINTNYAAPHEAIPIESVQTRFYIGFCRDEEIWKNNLQVFKNKKQAILTYAENAPYLEKYARKATLSYLTEFFEIIEEEKKLRKEMMEHCDILIKRGK